MNQQSVTSLRSRSKRILNLITEGGLHPGGISLRSRSAGTRRRVPFGECPGVEQAVIGASRQMAPDAEQVLHHAAGSGEALQMSGRFKAPYLALPLPRRLM